MHFGGVVTTQVWGIFGWEKYLKSTKKYIQGILNINTYEPFSFYYKDFEFFCRCAPKLGESFQFLNPAIFEIMLFSKPNFYEGFPHNFFPNKLRHANFFLLELALWPQGKTSPDPSVPPSPAPLLPPPPVIPLLNLRSASADLRTVPPAPPAGAPSGGAGWRGGVMNEEQL